MRIVIVGQRRFGKAVLEAFQSRGHEIVGVFVAPDKKGAEPDTLKLCALGKGIPLFQFDDLKSPEALSAMADLKSDMAVMAMCSSLFRKNSPKSQSTARFSFTLHCYRNIVDPVPLTGRLCVVKWKRALLFFVLLMGWMRGQFCCKRRFL